MIWAEAGVAVPAIATPAKTALTRAKVAFRGGTTLPGKDFPLAVVGVWRKFCILVGVTQLIPKVCSLMDAADDTRVRKLKQRMLQSFVEA